VCGGECQKRTEIAPPEIGTVFQFVAYTLLSKSLGFHEITSKFVEILQNGAKGCEIPQMHSENCVLEMRCKKSLLSLSEASIQPRTSL
jgi:hypothetical protein